MAQSNWFAQNAPESSFYGSTAPVSGQQYGGSAAPITATAAATAAGADGTGAQTPKPWAQPQQASTPYQMPGQNADGSLQPGYHWEWNDMGRFPVKDGDTVTPYTPLPNVMASDATNTGTISGLASRGMLGGGTAQQLGTQMTGGLLGTRKPMPASLQQYLSGILGTSF